MRWSVLAALALLVVAVGGCRYVDRLDAAPRVRLDGGPCGWNVVVDHESALWKESGCENGRPIAHRVRRLKPDELARLHAIIDRLPRDRAVLTQAEYAEIFAVLETITRMPEGGCWLEMYLTFEGRDGSTREWTVEPCEAPAIE